MLMTFLAIAGIGLLFWAFVNACTYIEIRFGFTWAILFFCCIPLPTMFVIAGIAAGGIAIGAPTETFKESPKTPCKQSCKCGCQDGKPCKCGQDIEGVYLIEGAGYHGAAIVTKMGEIYRVQFAVGGRNAVGVGIRQGDTLAVGWLQEEARGVTSFRIDGKNMIGRWAALPSDGKMKDERLTFLSALPKSDDD